MKKYIYISLCTLIFSNALSQTDPEQYFNKGEEYYKKGNYQKALLVFEKFGRKFPDDIGYPKAIYNTGIISLRLQDTIKAENIFIKILNSNFNDLEGSGKDIMDNPYALYKHNSSEHLFEIYLTRHNYRKALDYLIMSDKIYEFYADCANAAVEYDISTAISYSKCYIGLGNNDKAIEVLMPYIFPVLFGGVKEAVNNLVPLLKLKYGEAEFEKEVNSMTENIYIDKEYKKVFTKLFKDTIRFNFHLDIDDIVFEIKLEKNELTDDEIKEYAKNKLQGYYFYKLSKGGPIEHYKD